MAVGVSRAWGNSRTARTIWKMRRELETAFRKLEKKDETYYPTLHACDTALTPDGGDVTLKGAELLADGACATLLCTDATTEKSFTVKSLVPGTGGNSYTVVVETGDGALAVDLTGTTLTVTLASGGSTTAAIVAAINADSNCDGVLGAVVTDAGDIENAISGTLAGGSGGTYKVYCNGQECPPANGDDVAWEDTQIVCTVPSLTGRAFGDVVTFQVLADDVMSNSLAVKLGAGAGADSATAVAGGAGDAADLTAGDGGANTGGATGEAGGAGGAATLEAGAGGDTNSTGADNAGAGGDVAVTAGDGGDASDGTGDGGAGGSVTITPGSGGSTTGGSAGADGTVKIPGELNVYKAGAAAAAVVKRFGPTNDEGVKTCIIDETLSPSAVETNLTNTIPAGSVIRAVLANCEAALTGGGTTVTWSVGTAGDPDKYGTAGYPSASDSLAKNSKSNWMGATQVASAEQICLTGAATGGASDGDTALTVGSVRIVVIYDTYDALDDAA